MTVIRKTAGGHGPNRDMPAPQLPRGRRRGQARCCATMPALLMCSGHFLLAEVRAHGGAPPSARWIVVCALLTTITAPLCIPPGADSAPEGNEQQAVADTTMLGLLPAAARAAADEVRATRHTRLGARRAWRPAVACQGREEIEPRPVRSWQEGVCATGAHDHLRALRDVRWRQAEEPSVFDKLPPPCPDQVPLDALEGRGPPRRLASRPGLVTGCYTGSRSRRRGRDHGGGRGGREGGGRGAGSGTGGGW